MRPSVRHHRLTARLRWMLTGAMGLLLPATGLAQGDGPRSHQLAPVGLNVFTPTYLNLTGDFDFTGSIRFLDADVTSDVLALTYQHTFGLAGQLSHVRTIVVLGGVDGEARVRDVVLSSDASGLGDWYTHVKVGLVGTPALAIPEFVKHRPGFQLSGLFGVYVPTGTYESDRALNLGTNRWAFRFAAPIVVPLRGPAPATLLEVTPSLVVYTDNDDPFDPPGPLEAADNVEQDPLFILENHLSHDFTRTVWGSVDVRWQNGGETTTDGEKDDNETNQLGGGFSLGVKPAVFLEFYGSYGWVWAGDDGNELDMWRLQGRLIF